LCKFFCNFIDMGYSIVRSTFIYDGPQLRKLSGSWACSLILESLIVLGPQTGLMNIHSIKAHAYNITFLVWSLI
jgi:hypothetical protein